MSYNTTSSQLASVTRSALSQMITDARRTVTPTERPMIEMAGQVVTHVLKGVSDDALVDLQIHGSDLPSQDARVWFVSITTRRIKPLAAEPPADTPWDPSQGPFVSSDASTPAPTPTPADTTAPATDAQPAAAPGDTTAGT